MGYHSSRFNVLACASNCFCITLRNRLIVRRCQARGTKGRRAGQVLQEALRRGNLRLGNLSRPYFSVLQPRAPRRVSNILRALPLRDSTRVERFEDVQHKVRAGAVRGLHFHSHRRRGLGSHFVHCRRGSCGPSRIRLLSFRDFRFRNQRRCAGRGALQETATIRRIRSFF
jgi:hypothetical protein